MGSRKGMNAKLKKFVERNYKDSKSDLYTCFIEKSIDYALQNKFVSMVTQHSFMFTDDYKELRVKLLDGITIENMVHLGTDAFPEINGEVVQTTSFVIRNMSNLSHKGLFIRLVDFSCEEKSLNVHNPQNHYSNYSNKEFKDITGTPWSYWISEVVKDTFLSGEPFEVIGKPRAGITTGDNERFLRNWHEVLYTKIGFGFKSVEEFHNTSYLYVPYNKGGKQRKWYGNNDFVIKFDMTNYNALANQGNHLPSRQHYFAKCITWSDISGRDFAARYCDNGSVFDVKGIMNPENKTDKTVKIS